MIEIPLTQNQVALIDDEDFELVSQYKWCASYSKTVGSFYAITHIYNSIGVRTTLKMHRLIMNSAGTDVIDHINHDTLDNRKFNLRKCTKAQNNKNSKMYNNNKSGYKGVSLRKDINKWQAIIRINGKPVRLGYFENPYLAHLAYCEAAIINYGEFYNYEHSFNMPEV